MTRPPRKKLRRLAALLAIVLIVIASAAMLYVKFKAGPSVVKSQLQFTIKEFWGGSVKVDDVDFSLFGEQSIGKIEILDKSGRRWLTASKIGIQIANKFSLTPTATKLTIGNVEISGYVMDGEFDVQRKPSTKKKQKANDLEIEIASLDVKMDVVHGQRKMSLHPLQCNGLTILMRDAEGIDAAIRSGVLTVKDRVIPFTNLKFSTSQAEDGIRLDDFTCSALGGEVAGGAKLTDINKFGGSGSLSFQKISAVDLAKLLNPTWIITQGVASGRATFRLSGMTIDDLTGTAEGFVDDCDMEKIELYASLLNKINIKPSDISGSNDIAARCSFAWPLVTIEEMRLTNKMAAFVIEPGGTINIPQRTMDLFVLDGRIDNLRKDSPGMDILAALTRFHVAGRWDVPDSQTIELASMRSIEPPEARFMKQAGQSDGEMGGFDEVINMMSGRKSDSRPANGNGKNGAKSKPAVDGSSSTSKPAGSL